MRRCDERTPWGRCCQPGTVPVEGFVRKVRCVFHAAWADRLDAPDRAYHEKIARGLLQPVATYLTDGELRATLHGRSRGDGRRLDAFCLDDQIDASVDT